MTNTTSLLEVAQKIHAILEAEKTELGLMGNFFGDQQSIVQVPTACTEPVRKRKDLQGANRYCIVTFQVAVLLYHARVQDSQLTRAEADAFAEAIEAKIDSYVEPLTPKGTLGGLVVHGLVTNFESGYTYRGNELFRSVNMTYEGMVKQILP